jgi:antirestriction protein ArdC
MGSAAHQFTRDRRSAEAPKVDHVAEALARLDAGIAELATSDGWQRWLGAQAKFHRYSPFNVYLIAAQTGGEATRVAGFHAWKALGRSVRKGERAIWILAPLARTIRETDESTGEESARRVVTGFRGVPVFDVAQTDGTPLAEPCSRLDGDAPHALYDDLRACAHALGYELKIAYSAADANAVGLGAANGLTDIAAHVIRLAAFDRSPAQLAKTLAHELGHVLLHGETGGYAGTCRGVAELEAESVAYCVLSAVGVDAGAYTFGYVSHWQGETKEARDGLRASAQRIAGAARSIIAVLLSEDSADAEQAA